MRRFIGWRALVVLGALITALSFGTVKAQAAHGVAQTKQCESPTKIGDAYRCSGQILNVVDTGHDTIKVTGLSDTVHSSAGEVATGGILSTTGLIFSGAVSCTGGSGAGTAGSPYLGATSCTMPFGSSMTTVQFSHYTVLAGDFDIPTTTSLAAASAVGATNVKLASTSLSVGQQFVIDPLGANPETRTATSVGTSGSGGTGVSFATPLAFAHASGVRVDLFAHRLTDTLQWNWNNTCISDPDGDCTTNDQIATAGASSVVSKLDSSTLTAIHNASHTVVTAAAAGVVVHDFITVNGQPGSPVPSGTVSLAWFTNGTCAGSAASSKNETLTGNGTVDATDFPQGPLAAGKYSFQATYLGDATYNGSTGACEPLTVVDANIQITPTATNRVGFAHTFTAHVNVNDGNGFANAPNGTVINFSVAAGGVGTLSSSFCTTSGGTGSCSVNDNSSTPGKDVVTASTSLVVATVSLTRSTDGVGLNSGPATKTWVDARIHITPSATNRVGFPHTFVAHVEKNLGDGNGWVDAAGVAVQITVANSLGGSANPAGPFNALTNANGLTFATFTSATPGKVTGHAVSSLNLGSQQDPIFIQTDGLGQNGSDAVKTFVDARIHITPDATNRVGFQHTFVAHVEKNLGDGNGWVDAAGVAVQITVANSLGASANPPGPFNALTNANGLTFATFISNTVGKVTGHAVSSLNLGSQQDPIFIQTDGQGQNGSNAVKTFVDARIHITPTATNRVGQPHTFTAHVEKNLGDGNGWVDAAGVAVQITLANAAGASATPPGPFNALTNANGLTTATFTSNTPGTVTGHAVSSLNLGSQQDPIFIQTDGLGQNGSDAVKTFVDARIHITPTATNRVGAPHTFTAHLEKNLGSGWVDAAGETVTITLTNGGAASATPSGPFTGTTNAAGFSRRRSRRATPGTVTGHASSSLNLGSLQDPIHVETDGTGQNGSNAVKTFVDARIHITPTATNRVGAPHTFTAHLEKNLGSGWVDAAGETVTITLTNGGAASATPSGPFTGTTNAAGLFAATFTSNTPGTVTGHAVELAEPGLAAGSDHVETDGTGQNGSDAVKTFVDARIHITPDATNRVGAPHTFTAFLEKNLGRRGWVAAGGRDGDDHADEPQRCGSATPAGPFTGHDERGRPFRGTFTSATPGQVTGHARAR